MMEATLEKIIGKVSDFKICMACKAVNWYENESCINCEKDKFRGKIAVRNFAHKEIKFWINHEKYTETEAWEVGYDI